MFDTPQYLLARGNALARAGRYAEAEGWYRHVIAMAPGHAEAHNNLGVMLAEQRQLEAALPWYRQAIALQPAYADAHYNLGNALKQLQRLDEAVASYRQALALRPDFAGAHLNLGIAIAHRGQPLDALAEYEEALRLSPGWLEAHNNRGLALAHLGRDDEALAEYRRALEIDPDFADAHYNRSLSLLTQGKFADGWTEFEWRWRLAELRPRPFTQPAWDGSSLEGRTILLHAEQGMGDTIQFIRYAPLVKRCGGTVIVECQEALLPLLAGAAGVDQWVGRGRPLPAFDAHFPLMSLGWRFTPTIAEIPATIPYLAADPARVDVWRQALGGPGKVKVGIAWQGSPGYRWDRLRSIPLTAFAPLAAVPGVRLVSLQKGPGTEQLALPRSFDVLDLGPHLDGDGAFVDTAAVMRCLDLVVTSDTAIAHLAGALGVPVWVALSHAPEWRWLRDREDSPWYPTMRLVRQTRLHDWAEVFGRMAGDLTALVHSARDS